MNYGFTYQISGTYITGQELIKEIPYHPISIKKIGVQLEQGESIVLNNQNFIMGKTGRLEFNDVNITSIKLSSNKEQSSLPVIIDVLCIKEEKE